MGTIYSLFTQIIAICPLPQKIQLVQKIVQIVGYKSTFLKDKKWYCRVFVSTQYGHKPYKLTFIGKFLCVF